MHKKATYQRIKCYFIQQKLTDAKDLNICQVKVFFWTNGQYFLQKKQAFYKKLLRK